MTAITILKPALGKSGGVEKVTRRLIESFQNRGCPVQLLTTSASRHEWVTPDLPCPVHVLGQRSWISSRHLQQFDRECRKFLASHPTPIVLGMDRHSIQTHYRAGNGVHRAYLANRGRASSPLKRLSLKLSPLHRTILDLEQRTFESPQLQRLITNSHMVKEEILSYYATDPAKITVVHNGVEWNELCSDFERWPSERSALLQRLGLDPGRFQFLFVGHGYRRKGLSLLLKGLALLPRDSFQLAVVGKEKYPQKALKLVEELGLTHNVRVFGDQPTIRPFLSASDALVIPSLYDPFANVTLEALAMGLFIVTSKHNGGKEVLTNETGTVIDDLLAPASVAASLSRALCTPKTPRSATLIRHSVANLDFSNQLDRVIEAILN